VKLRRAQTNFAQGEFSPLMSSRRDLQLYRNGAAKLLNRRPLSQGGTTTRPALEHVATLAHTPAALIPAKFRADQRYVFALSSGRLDAWTADGTPCTPVTGCDWQAYMFDAMTWLIAGDTIIVLHEDLNPQRITRTGATTFSVEDIAFETPGFGRIADPSITIETDAVGAIGSTATLTASADLWTSASVGQWLRWNGKRAQIDSFTSATEVNVTWRDATTGVDLTATPNWQEQAWTQAHGFPSCGTVLDGRLWLAATRAQPSAIWASRVGAPFNFDPRDATDADAITENVGGIDAVPRVRHLAQLGRLLILTDSGVWFVPSSDTRAVTPSTFALRPVSDAGVSTARPAQNDGALLYVDITGRVAREARWSDTLQTYTTDALTLLAEHLVVNPVAAAGLEGDDEQPGKLVVLVNADGSVAVQHSIAAERVNAWVPWATSGLVKSVAATGRTLFLLVVRNGTWRLERAHNTAAPLDAMMSKTSGGRTRSWGPFPHLAGLTVGVVSNGHDIGDAVVDGSGNLLLDERQPAVTSVDVGLRFEQIVRPMPVDVDLPDGDASGLRKRLVRILVDLVESGDLRVNGTPVVMGFQGDDFTTPPPPFTGTKEVRARGISRDVQFDVTVPKAYRVTVTGLTREVSVDG